MKGGKEDDVEENKITANLRRKILLLSRCSHEWRSDRHAFPTPKRKTYEVGRIRQEG